MSGRCAYANIFGAPGTGVHSYRILGFAAVDLIGTILIGWALAAYMGWSVWVTIVAALVIGEMMHCLFCVSTPVTRALGCRTA